MLPQVVAYPPESTLVTDLRYLHRYVLQVIDRAAAVGYRLGERRGAMVERIPGLPDDVLGFSAKGTVTVADYETVIIPAVEELFRRRDKVRFLYHLGKDFTGLEAAAAWDDAKLGLKHFRGWDRMAVVSDVEWIRAAVKVFGLAMPGHVRVFHDGELDDAVRWITQ
jgi:hypothetical protein